MEHLHRVSWDQPGTVSVWCGPLGGRAAFARLEHEPHFAASLMKVPILVALHRRGRLDDLVPVVNDFDSAALGASRFALTQRHDQDDAVWQRIGDSASLRWLADRMITRSSNLATNLVLAEVGMAAAAEVWRDAGASGSRLERGIGDAAAEAAGLTNTVSAADAGRLFDAIATGRLGPPDGMLSTLFAQQRAEDLAAGLPPGTRVAHKNGWVTGVRHAAGVVFPDDAPPFVLAVCATTPLAINDPGDDACRLVRTVAEAAWRDRHHLTR
jgi:beta-lactamase class A